MTIGLAEDMARSTTDISDELLERWLELRCCFSVYNRAFSPLVIVGMAFRILVAMVTVFHIMKE